MEQKGDTLGAMDDCCACLACLEGLAFVADGVRPAAQQPVPTYEVSGSLVQVIDRKDFESDQDQLFQPPLRNTNMAS